MKSGDSEGDGGGDRICYNLSMQWEGRTKFVGESTWSHGITVSMDLDELQRILSLQSVHFVSLYTKFCSLLFSLHNL